MQGPVLQDHVVRLEPLGLGHVDALRDAASEDRSSFALAPVPRDRAEMVAYVEAALDDARARRAVPYAVVRLGGGGGGSGSDRVVGSMRLMSLEWWTWTRDPVDPGQRRSADAGDPPNVAEIGHAWLAASAQRTRVNTAACLLLMRHAFDEWRVERLVLKTDARNHRSRTAIARLGGRFEGILRAHKPAADGLVRDTAMFSILRAEWPSLRPQLDALLRAND